MVNSSPKVTCNCLHRSQFPSNSSGSQRVKQIQGAGFTLGYKANDLLLGWFGKKCQFYFLSLLEEVQQTVMPLSNLLGWKTIKCEVEVPSERLRLRWWGVWAAAMFSSEKGRTRPSMAPRQPKSLIQHQLYWPRVRAHTWAVKHTKHKWY